MSDIKYIFIGNLVTSKVIYEEFKDDSLEHQAKIQELFNGTIVLKEIKYDEKSKISTNDGNYYFTCLFPNTFYLVLADKVNNEDLIYGVFKDINSSIRNYLDEDENVSDDGKLFLEQQIIKYKENDKKQIIEVNENHKDKETEILESNKQLNKLVQLKQQWDNIREDGDFFVKNDSEITKAKCWIKWKIAIIVILLIIFALLVIIVPIVATETTEDDIVNEGDDSVVITIDTNSTNTTTTNNTIENNNSVNTTDTNNSTEANEIKTPVIVNTPNTEVLPPTNYTTTFNTTDPNSYGYAISQTITANNSTPPN